MWWSKSERKKKSSKMKLASFRVPLNCTELQFLSKCASVGHLHQMCAGNEQDYDFFSPKAQISTSAQTFHNFWYDLWNNKGQQWPKLPCLLCVPSTPKKKKKKDSFQQWHTATCSNEGIFMHIYIPILSRRLNISIWGMKTQFPIWYKLPSWLCTGIGSYYPGYPI